MINVQRQFPDDLVTARRAPADFPASSDAILSCKLIDYRAEHKQKAGKGERFPAFCPGRPMYAPRRMRRGRGINPNRERGLFQCHMGDIYTAC